MATKAQNLKAAVDKFTSSGQQPSDFLALFQTVHMCLRQGSGLTWSEVREVLVDQSESSKQQEIDRLNGIIAVFVEGVTQIEDVSCRCEADNRATDLLEKTSRM